MRWDWMPLFIGRSLRNKAKLKAGLQRIRKTESRMLQIGDRVELTMDTLLDRKGKQGVVVGKFTPHWSTGCWEVTVRFDGNFWDTRFHYPTSLIRKVDTENGEIKNGT